MERTGLDRLRIDVMAAIVKKDRNLVHQCLGRILDRVRDADRLDEASQKALNQIRLMVRRFHRAGRLDLSGPWAGMVGQIKHESARIVRREMKHPLRISFDGWQRATGLLPWALPVLMHELTLFQLTKGCSNSCRRCNEWALPAPRDHFSFDAVKKIVSMMAASGNCEAIYYGASDPLDWEEGPYTIVDVMEFVAARGIRPRYGLLTKIPRGKDRALSRLIAAGYDVGISVTARNRGRFQRVAEKAVMPLSVHHDHDELLIPSGLDEDFISVKPSITDNYGCEITPEGASSIIPTFTSALNPTGQYRMPVTDNSSFVLAKKTGRAAMQVEYYKPLFAVDMATGRLFRLGRLLPPQVENILLDHGRYDLTPPGMTSFPEYLSTYDVAAVAKRRELAPAAIKGLREKYGVNGSLKYASGAEKQAFKIHAAHYMACCRPESMAGMKRYMISYYLKAAADYLQTHPSEREIIGFLRDDGEKDTLERLIDRMGGDMERVLDETTLDTHGVVRGLINRLVADPEDPVTLAFTGKYPAAFDDRLDRFVPL